MAVPTLTMIPSGYKTQKVYSVLPTNGDGDLTFDRTTTATRVNKNGLIEQVATDVPRLDYSDGSCPSLLLEPSSANLVIDSAKGNYGGWQYILTNTISPDGTNNAFIPTPEYGYRRYEEIIPANTYPTGQKLTYSWYRKRISTPTGLSRNGDLNVRGLINLTSLESNNATQIESNINGFDRFQVVVEIKDGSLESTFRAYFGDVVEAGNSSVAYFGHQFEALPYATSYIPTPTTGIASRSADSASKDGLSSYISSTAGVLYAEIASLSDEDNTTRIISLNSGTLMENRIFIGFSNTDNRIYVGIRNLEVAYFTPTDSTVFHKIAIKYEDNNTKFFVNGNQIGLTETTQTVPSGLSQIQFTAGSTTAPFHGKVKDLRVYNTALTDLELQELTTI